MKIWSCLQELSWPTELYWHIVVRWARGVWRSPELTCETCFFIEYSSSFCCVPWESVSIAIRLPISSLVGAGSWWLFDVGKSFFMRFDGSEFGVGVLAIAMSSWFIFEVIGLVVAGSWCIVFHFMFLDDIDCFTVDGILLGHTGVDLIFILDYLLGTLPTPGCLWIWGTRYERSGDFYLERPKVFPFVY